MRLLFFLIVLANVVALAYGQGFFGTPPSEEGREPRMLMLQRNPEAVTLGAPMDPSQLPPSEPSPAPADAHPAAPHGRR